MLYGLLQILFVAILALFSLSGCQKRAQKTMNFVGNTVAGGAYGVAAGTMGIVGQKTVLKKMKKPEGTPTALAAACVGSTVAGAVTGGPVGAVSGGVGGAMIARDLEKNQIRLRSGKN